MKVELINITPQPIKTIFDSYRICYAKGGYNSIGSRSPEEMEKFIKPLMAENHTSPLEHVAVTFYIEGISRACQNQLVRHRTGKYNIQSQRYVSGENFEFVTPRAIENNPQALEVFNNYIELTKNTYSNFIDLGIKKEDARSILPNATTCNLIVTFDINNFRKFLAQRLCVHAQEEIRTLASVMCMEVKKYIPFVDYKVMNCGRICNQCIGKVV